MEQNYSLPFLDVLVSRDPNNNCFSTSIFRKPTFTGLGTHFLSFIPELFKINSLSTLLHRCYNLTSSWFALDEEIRFLINFFLDNGYPRDWINSRIRRFIDGKFNSNSNLETPKTDINYIPLPFYGHLSFNIRKKLNGLFRDNFPLSKFHFIFTNPNTIGSFFKFKDSVPAFLTPNVIYEFNCSSCKTRYVGESKRNLTYRFAEHKGVSVRTDRPLSHPPHSAIWDHAVASSHPIERCDFNILSKAR